MASCRLRPLSQTSTKRKLVKNKKKKEIRRKKGIKKRKKVRPVEKSSNWSVEKSGWRVEVAGVAAKQATQLSDKSVHSNDRHRVRHRCPSIDLKFRPRK